MLRPLTRPRRSAHPCRKRDKWSVRSGFWRQRYGKHEDTYAQFVGSHVREREVEELAGEASGTYRRVTASDEEIIERVPRVTLRLRNRRGRVTTSRAGCGSGPDPPGRLRVSK